MWTNEFFKDSDKRVRDICPVCKTFFGQNYLRVERIYYCRDCDKVVSYHPYEKVPKMVPKKKSSNLDQHYTPGEEDIRLAYGKMVPLDELPPEEPPPNPKRNWWE